LKGNKYIAYKMQEKNFWLAKYKKADE